MDIENILREVSDKNADIEKYAEIVLKDGEIRDELVNQMVTHKHIMVYYHCYYILSRASSFEPELFYKYWEKFQKLLDHKNSYHRTIGLVMISNLASADTKNLFDKISDRYFMFINDEKITTARDCAESTRKLLKAKPEYIDAVVSLYLKTDKISKFKENQKALLVHDIFVTFEEVYEKTIYKKEINEMILANIDNRSPKTRKKARELMKKFQLEKSVRL